MNTKDKSTKEIWKDVKGFEGLYQVSNLGRVKSLSRIDPRNKPIPEKILKPSRITSQNKYHRVKLSKEGKSKSFKIHQLVAGAFLNHTTNGTHEIVIDHIDSNKTNNAASNLRLISNRENSPITGASKYRGVSWNSKLQKWKAKIHKGDATTFLGYFESEEDAGKAYSIALRLQSRGRKVRKEEVRKILNSKKTSKGTLNYVLN